MHASDSRLSVSLKLLGPHQHLVYRKDISGQPTDELEPDAQYHTFFTQTKELWDQYRTHAVLDGNGQHVLRADSSAAAAHHQAPYQAPASSTEASSIHPTPVGHDDCDDEEELPRCPKMKISRSPQAASSSSSTGTVPSTGTPRKPTKHTAITASASHSSVFDASSAGPGNHRYDES